MDCTAALTLTKSLKQNPPLTLHFDALVQWGSEQVFNLFMEVKSYFISPHSQKLVGQSSLSPRPTPPNIKSS